jgi:hypothetical protein
MLDTEAAPRTLRVCWAAQPAWFVKSAAGGVGLPVALCEMRRAAADDIEPQPKARSHFTQQGIFGRRIILVAMG